MLLMVALLVTMSASAAARRYAKISRAWVEHDVILDGQRGMKVHLYLTVSGMKRRSVSLTARLPSTVMWRATTPRSSTAATVP